jgi:Tfp pilus assembly protein PilZ
MSLINIFNLTSNIYHGHSKNSSIMEKRAFQRTINNISITFCCCITDYYSGLLTNISEKGMFISTPICFPLDSRLNMLINSNKEILNIPVRVRWMRKSTDMYDGIGVEVLELTNKYLNFVRSINFT